MLLQGFFRNGKKKIHNTPAADPPPVCNPNSGCSPVKETADRRMQRNTSWDVVHRRWSIAAATVILQSVERVFSSLTKSLSAAAEAQLLLLQWSRARVKKTSPAAACISPPPRSRNPVAQTCSMSIDNS
jgi:hypothetical protein